MGVGSPTPMFTRHSTSIHQRERLRLFFVFMLHCYVFSVNFPGRRKHYALHLQPTQPSVSPGLPVLPHQADEGVDLGRGDVLLQQLAVIVQ